MLVVSRDVIGQCLSILVMRNDCDWPMIVGICPPQKRFRRRPQGEEKCQNREVAVDPCV